MVALFRGRTPCHDAASAGTIASLGALLTFTLSDDIQVAAADLVVQPPSASTLLSFTHTLTNTGAEPAIVQGRGRDPRRRRPAGRPGDLRGQPAAAAASAA